MEYSEIIFWFSALAGSLFFIVKVFFVIFLGLSDDENTDHAFKVFSIHSLTGFSMMFGWVGLACIKQFYLLAPLSLLIAFFAGCAMMLITSFLFKGAFALISHGDQYTLDEAIGKKATVYQRIAENGEGKVQLTLGGMMREFSAIAENKREIPSFAKVEVTGVLRNQTLIVK